MNKNRSFRDTLKTASAEFRNAMDELRPYVDLEPTDEEKRILAEVMSQSACVIPGFLSSERCAELRAELDRVIQEYDVWTDDVQSDHRVFGIERLSKQMDQHYQNDSIVRILKLHDRSQACNGFLMGNHVEAKEGNLGSGSGWHRDDSIRRQTKAILYLSDVTEENGPFEYIEGSHKPLDVVGGVARSWFGYGQNRFTEDEIAQVLEHQSHKQRTITGEAGTLVFVNTHCIHRGRPIVQGSRYALTHYSWGDRAIPEHIHKLLNPKPRSQQS